MEHIDYQNFILGFGLFFLIVVTGAMLWAVFTILEKIQHTLYELVNVHDRVLFNIRDNLAGIHDELHQSNRWISSLTSIWEENKIANTLYFLKGEFISRKDTEGVMLIEAAEKLLTKKRRKKNAIPSDSPSVEG